MKKVIMFDEDEFSTLRFAIVESIIENSKKGYGVRFTSRDSDDIEEGNELEDMAMRGHLMLCIDHVWPV